MLVDDVSENSLFVTKTSLFELEAKVSSEFPITSRFCALPLNVILNLWGKRSREDCKRPSF